MKNAMWITPFISGPNPISDCWLFESNYIYINIINIGKFPLYFHDTQRFCCCLSPIIPPICGSVWKLGTLRCTVFFFLCVIVSESSCDLWAMPAMPHFQTHTHAIYIYPIDNENKSTIKWLSSWWYIHEMDWNAWYIPIICHRNPSQGNKCRRPCRAVGVWCPTAPKALTKASRRRLSALEKAMCVKRCPIVSYSEWGLSKL